MPRNDERRTALLDAAVEVLAARGARGLTFRAVDRAAGVPTGTASNYFADRDALLGQVGAHVHVRLTPDPAALAASMTAPRDRALVTRLMLDILDRVEADRAGYLALLELRLESTRRPVLREDFTRTIEDELASNVAFHLDAGLPGDRRAVELLHAAMTGVIVERLTLPGVLGDPRALVESLVDRVTRP